MHVKGFNRKVAATVHRTIWHDLNIALEGHRVVGCQARIGMYHYWFKVEAPTPDVTVKALKIINELALTWIDPRDKSISTIRCQTDKSANEKHANKVYGELRKLMEQHFKDSMDVDEKNYQVRTSGPRGPIYVEVPGDAWEVCNFIKCEISGEISWKTQEAFLGPLSLTAEALADMQTKAITAANKWE